MTTLEEEIIIPLQRQMAAQKKSEEKSKFRFWPGALVAALGLLTGILLGGLFFLKAEMTNSWKNAIENFNWLVMAEGDSVAIDEVGRFLTKMDGVLDVTAISADQVLAKAKEDPVIATDLSLISINPFPSGWVVHWKADSFSLEKLQEAFQDVKSFPGVVDIASDPRGIEKIRFYKIINLRLRLILSMFLIGAIAFLLIALGRISFGIRPNWLGPKNIFFGISIFVGFSAIGASLLFLLW